MSHAIQCRRCKASNCRRDYQLRWRDDRFGDYFILTCLACRVTFTDPFPTAEELEALYASNQYHTEDRPTGDPQRADKAELERRIKREDSFFDKYDRYLPPSGSVLDIGSGWGFLLKNFQQRGYDITGCEISDRTRSFAEQRLGLTHLFPLAAEEVNELPVSSFDVVIMRHVLEHLVDPWNVLSTLRELVARDGRLILEVPNYGSYDRRAYGEQWPGFGPYHLWYFSRATLSQALQESGFSPLAFHEFMSERIGGTPPRKGAARMFRRVVSRLGGRLIFNGRSIGVVAEPV